MLDNLGTHKNITEANAKPNKDVYAIIESPKTCVIKAAIRGPNANPREPILIKIPILFEQSLPEK